MSDESPGKIGEQIPALNFCTNKLGTYCYFNLAFEYRNDMSCLKKVGTMIVKELKIDIL